MAEWGKGDDRWIVQEREDGANVNQWHWSEKDCLAWSRERFERLFADAKLVEGGGATAVVTGIESVEGEAFLNVRKKKLIPSYELCLKLNFKADVSGESVQGKIVFPYIAEENQGEAPEVQVKPETDTAAARTAKDAIYAAREKVLFPPVATFVEEFHAGKPAGHVAEADKGPSASQGSATAAAGAAAKAAAVEKKDKKSATKTIGQTITLKETFHASARDLYEALLDENRIKAFTQSDATVSRDVGGAFRMFGGSIEGVQRALEPHSRIEQEWRFSTWPDGVASKVVITIEEPDPGHTILTLTQTGVPDEDKFGNHDVVGTTERGWKDLIFYKIRAVFGYGL